MFNNYIAKSTSLIIVLCLILCLCGCSTGKIDAENEGVVRFVYSDKNIETRLSNDDLNKIADILSEKQLYYSEPACPFSEDIAIIIDNKTYCVAGDGCGIIYLMEKNLCFDLSDEENNEIRSLLENYGFYFPCV